MKRLIGIAGKAGSGKNTVAMFAIEQSRYTLPIALADPIYSMADVLLVSFGIDPEWGDRKWKEEVHPLLSVSPRRILQTLGTEWGRQLIAPDLWISLAKGRIARLMSSGFGVIVTDVRFENEADMIRAEGGCIWHVDREVPQVEGHVSEDGIVFKSGDTLIDNFGTLEELKIEVCRGLKRFL